MRSQHDRARAEDSAPFLVPAAVSAPAHWLLRCQREQGESDGVFLQAPRIMAAPLAQFDEDWQDFYEFKAPPASYQLDQVNSNGVPGTSGDCGTLEHCLEDFSELDNFSGEIVSFKSMEDLVNDFDEKLTVCFRNYNTNTENIAPVKPITEESIMRDDEIWNALTDNYGNVMAVDWKTSHTRALHLPTLNLSEKALNGNINLDLSDDEELRDQLDMHSIIVSCINDEPLFTAEQVIEEIEEMMQESPDPEEDDTPTQSDRLSILSQEIQTLKRSNTSNSYEERVKRLPMAELNELLEEIETAIKHYSEELIQQLALRDELEFEKEVKNSFISILIEVQNKQKEHKETMKKKKKQKNGTPQNGKQEKSHMPGTRFSMEGLSNVIQNGFRQTFGSSGGEKQYLTTVIPYEKKAGPPSVEDLQILTKILQAMKEDSEKVPSLLTDYILKVLCPT
ncbi:fasciculation and elongation protein zeta-2-like isoform X3 [Chiloscyllium plagiosum]|uniref:fasciculation and elongation protein zeta-2-like isoform X3 n=1 Tax=Chiloscyllium plagiosum TaxID=36176 RepID=UPI001CB7CFC6|nr:fasciculation and elongation protein zeta-2-like isoform X3 [Chiloscyllium plagiosum]